MIAIGAIRYVPWGSNLRLCRVCVMTIFNGSRMHACGHLITVLLGVNIVSADGGTIFVTPNGQLTVVVKDTVVNRIYSYKLADRNTTRSAPVTYNYIQQLILYFIHVKLTHATCSTNHLCRWRFTFVSCSRPLLYSALFVKWQQEKLKTKTKKQQHK